MIRRKSQKGIIDAKWHLVCSKLAQIIIGHKVAAYEKGVSCGIENQTIVSTDIDNDAVDMNKTNNHVH